MRWMADRQRVDYDEKKDAEIEGDREDRAVNAEKKGQALLFSLSEGPQRLIHD